MDIFEISLSRYLSAMDMDYEIFQDWQKVKERNWLRTNIVSTKLNEQFCKYLSGSLYENELEGGCVENFVTVLARYTNLSADKLFIFATEEKRIKNETRFAQTLLKDKTEYFKNILSEKDFIELQKLIDRSE